MVLLYLYIYIVVSTPVDNIAPVISGCPDPITQIVSPGTPSSTVTWIKPTATDDSGVPPQVTSSHQSGDTFTLGVTTVIYTFSDATGNAATCTFDITGNFIFKSLNQSLIVLTAKAYSRKVILCVVLLFNVK